MDKLKINLIPPEIKERAKKDAKRGLINKISIAFLGLLILVTAGILGTVVFQKGALNQVNAQIEQEKGKINSKRDTEAVLKLLKNRVDTINQFTENRYKQGEVFDLITGLFPPDVTLETLQINKTAKISVSGQTSSTQSLQQFFNNLTDPKTNEGKITSVKVENLNKNQQGGIRFDLIVNLAGGVN
jgi:Tfp pilus assembly protein PilN